MVAFETEIAEPDKDGGELRYRGVNIEDLVGKVPFEQVWGLLVDEVARIRASRTSTSTSSAAPGTTSADLQSALAALRGEWKLGQFIDIDDEQAKEDLAPALVPRRSRSSPSRLAARDAAGARRRRCSRARPPPSGSSSSGAAS